MLLFGFTVGLWGVGGTAGAFVGGAGGSLDMEAFQRITFVHSIEQERVMLCTLCTCLPHGHAARNNAQPSHFHSTGAVLRIL